MPVDMQSKLGNWVHLHQHPCIPMPGNLTRRELAARFLFPRTKTECSQAVWANSLGAKCEH
jgi:hypothetical protein